MVRLLDALSEWVLTELSTIVFNDTDPFHTHTHTMFFGAGSFQSLQRTVTFIDFWLNNKPPNVIISDSPNSADSLVHRFTVLSIFSDNLFVPV